MCQRLPFRRRYLSSLVRPTTFAQWTRVELAPPGWVWERAVVSRPQGVLLVPTRSVPSASPVRNIHPRCAGTKHADPKQIADAADRACAGAPTPLQRRSTVGMESTDIAGRALVGSSGRFSGMQLRSQPGTIPCWSSRSMNRLLARCRSRIDSIRFAKASTEPVSRASVRRSESKTTARS